MRRRSAGSVLFAASGLPWTEWRVERRPLVEYMGRRFPLVKTGDRTVTELFPLTVFYNYISIIDSEILIVTR